MARIDDGYQTTINLGGIELNALGVWEKEPQPPGMDGGGPVDTTTMRNTLWRTRNPKHLITLSELNVVCAYDPVIFTVLYPAFLNVLNTIIVTFPDLSTLTFYGWLDKVIINPHREGEQPTANITIVPANQDGAGNESEPIYTAAP